MIVDNIRANKKLIVAIVLFFIISLIIEVFVFNFRSWESILYENQFKTYPSRELQFPQDVVKINENIFLSSNNELEFEINNINSEVNNLYLDVKILDNNYTNTGLEVKSNAIQFNIIATDEANNLYFELPQMTVDNTFPRTEYVKLNLAGNVEKLKVIFNNVENRRVEINSVDCNIYRPLMISKIRIMLLFFFLLFLYFFRPKSSTYKILCDFKRKRQIAVVVMIVLLQVSVFCFFASKNTWCIQAKNILPHHGQYQELAHSLVNGKVDLDLEAPEQLFSLENPYDYRLRIESCPDAPWDVSFYDGKFYVYFGVVPEVLLFLPFYLLTGRDLPIVVAVLLCLLLLCVGLCFLLIQLTEKKFNNLPFQIFCLLYLIIINSCGALYVAGRPDFYSIPIVLGMAFLCFGLGFWISGSKEPTKYLGKISIGSLFIALIAGCRPQLIVGSIFALFIFGKYWFSQKDGKILYKDKIKMIVMFLLPVIIVAVVLMYYNYIRFNSPFDFGANYNLTSNDMTKRGFRLDRIWTGLFYYLFVTPNISVRFPFLKQIRMDSAFQGVTISEWLYGGFLTTNLITWYNLLIFYFKKEMQVLKLFWPCIVSITVGLIIVILDTQMAGLLTRYYCDFSLFFLVPAASIIMFIGTMLKQLSKRQRSLFISTLIFLAIVTLSFCLFLTLRNEAEGLLQFNPDFYYYMYSVVVFWQ